MVSPGTAKDISDAVVESLPEEVARDLVFAVKAIGGLFILYLIFLGVRLYFVRKQTKMIEQMSKDISQIKRKLN